MKVVRYYKQLCIAKVIDARLEEGRHRKFLEFWQVLLHSNSQNETNKSTIKDNQSQLQTFTDRKQDGCKS